MHAAAASSACGRWCCVRAQMSFEGIPLAQPVKPPAKKLPKGAVPKEEPPTRKWVPWGRGDEGGTLRA